MTIAVIILVILVLILGAALLYYRQRLQQLRQTEAAKTEARRSAFISIISHQLRTPLSIIKGYLESLAAGDLGKLTDKQQEYTDEALKINRDTVRLVNDYLDAVKLDTETLEVSPEPVDLAAVVAEEIKRLTPLAKASNCELVFNKPDKSLPPVQADLIKIKQVVENTLTNAIKYIGGKGTATITLTDAGDRVRFSCADTGVGIPADQQAELFTKFFRAKNVIGRHTTGSGLGLYLAKMIVSALNGKIWIESTEDQGTTVYFELPKAE